MNVARFTRAGLAAGARGSAVLASSVAGVRALQG